MDEMTRSCIRHIFLSPRPNFPLMTAAGLLGMSLKGLKKEIADGVIVSVPTRLGERVTHEEVVAAAMRIFEQATIEEALGDDAAAECHEFVRRETVLAAISCARRNAEISRANAIDDVVDRC